VHQGSVLAWVGKRRTGAVRPEHSHRLRQMKLMLTI